ncbi:MAG TPA: reverse transcriptase-like protein [Candidatus Binatia bacterium]|nr:reverse transcriptase-like protein [Candidatus Binatia bacterium]
MSTSDRTDRGRHGQLFPEPAATTGKGTASLVTASIDGGARGNPGPAAYGIVLRKADGTTLLEAGKYVGRATNNVAEYYGLIAALDAAAQRGVRGLRVESDSELLVRQMQGKYRVKSPDLKPLHERAERLARGFERFEIAHVPRERNREADRLVNAALDGERGESRSREFATKIETRQNEPGGPLVRARYTRGTFQPEEAVDLPEGTEVFLTIRPISRKAE